MPAPARKPMNPMDAENRALVAKWKAADKDARPRISALIFVRNRALLSKIKNVPTEWLEVQAYLHLLSCLRTWDQSVADEAGKSFAGYWLMRLRFKCFREYLRERALVKLPDDPTEDELENARHTVPEGVHSDNLFYGHEEDGE